VRTRVSSVNIVTTPRDGGSVAHIPAGSTDFPVFRNMGNSFEDRQNRARVYSGRLVWRLSGGMAYLYRVFTKEWCGFKNLLNHYILQLDGAPQFSEECTRATQSCSPIALDRTCCKWRQPHTHTIRDEFDYRVDVCRVTQGAHIEGL
jgi:hypothetical protein